MRRVLLVCCVGAILPIALAVNWHGSSDPDYKALWDAGRAAFDGRSVYDAWFPYPPHSLLLFAPFAFLPLWPAYFTFNLLGAILFVWSAKPYLPKDFSAYLPLLTPAALFCLYFGQTGLIVGALWLLAFKGRWAAVALLTFKPHLGLLSALSLNRRTLAPTVGLTIVIAGLSAVLFGGWIDFVSAISRQAGAIGANTKWEYVGVSPAISFGFLGWLPFALAAAYLLSKQVTPFSAATAALLVSPYGFHYDMPVSSLGFALALHKEATPYRTAIFTLAMLIPVLVRFGAWIAPPLLLLALWAQVTTSRRAVNGPRGD